MAHTPGPWKFRKHLGGEEGEVIAQDVRFDTDFLYIAEIFGHYQDDECAANGRLIAAAPDLLAACEADQAFWQHYLNCPRCTGTFFCHEAANLMIEARKLRVVAIARAKGG